MSTQAMQAALGTRDRVLPETRLVAALIVPFLVAAFVILFFFPGDTDRLFAWAIGPKMTAMKLGVTYFTGVLFFSTVVASRSWRQVRVGFLPVTTFATLLGIATILHWDRFNHQHVVFWLWAGLYFTTPFLVFLLWWRNNRHVGPVPIAPEELRFPRPVRGVLAVMGVGGVLVSLLLFIIPDVMADVWAWSLSPLTARVIAATFAVFSAFAIGMALDPRWSSVRVPLRSQLASPLLALAAVIASWQDFDPSNSFTWLYVAILMLLFVIGLPALYFFMEARWTRGRRRAQAIEG